jgi:mannitol-1-phosphate 5-dehydrogenase
MPERVVIVGAGKIGCGHLAPLFADAGWHVIIAARRPDVVARLGAGPFTVVADGKPHRVRADAVLVGSEAWQEAVAGADLVATAVGARNVAALAEPLARALATRAGERAIDVWAVENGDAAPGLQDAIEAAAQREGLALPPTAVAGAIAWRAVTAGDWKVDERPSFVADASLTLVVDRGRTRCPIPDVPGIEATDAYAEDLMAKFLGFGAGHAMCAYLGLLRGHTYIHEAIADPLLRPMIQRSLQTSRRSLLSVDAASGEEVLASIRDIITRYTNAGLNDPLTRVARDPIRKLAPDGPLVGAALLVQRVTGRVPGGFARAIAGALAYRNPADAQAVRLQELVDRDGLAAVLRDVCDLEAEHPLAREVTRIHRLITASRTHAVPAG